MTLDHLMSAIGQLREAASAALGQHARAMERIQAETSLSPEGKREAANDQAAATNAILEDLEGQELALISREFERNERAVFGTPPTDSSGVIAFRDAQERAGRLTNDADGRTAAFDYLKQAKLSGDGQLASAVLSRALSLGWRDVVDAYRHSYPESASRLDDLVALGELRSSQHNFTRQMLYSRKAMY